MHSCKGRDLKIIQIASDPHIISWFAPPEKHRAVTHWCDTTQTSWLDIKCDIFFVCQSFIKHGPLTILHHLVFSVFKLTLSIFLSHTLTLPDAEFLMTPSPVSLFGEGLKNRETAVFPLGAHPGGLIKVKVMSRCSLSPSYCPYPLTFL